MTTPGEPADPTQPGLPKLARWREKNPGQDPPGGRWCEPHGRWEGTCHRHGGEMCHSPLMWGTTTCRMHAHKDAKMANAAANSQRRRRVKPREVDPLTALMEEIAYWAGVTAWVDAQVEQLSDEALTWGTAETRESTGGEHPGTTTIERAGLHVLVQWQQAAHREKARVAADALRANVDERLTALAEAQGATAYQVVVAALSHLELSEHQWELAREWMPRLMRQLMAGGSVVAGEVLG